MLDQIIATLTEKVGPRLTSEIGLTKENAEKSIILAGESAVNVIQEETAKGKVSELSDLFTKEASQLSENPIFTKIETMFLTKLSSSLNITGAKAINIKELLLPSLVKNIGQSAKTGGHFDISTLTGLLQSDEGSWRKMLGKFFKRS